MMKNYREPQAEIIRLEEDVVRTSGEPAENADDNLFEYPWNKE